MADDENCVLKKKCPDCEEVLPLSSFHKNKSRVFGVQCYCIKCRSIRDKKYYKNGGKERLHFWIKNNREKHNKYNTKYRHSKKGIENSQKYMKTEIFKNNIKKHTAKRRRKLGWIKMFDNPFNDSITIDWHHINDIYVVAIPRDIHALYKGYKQDKHRDLCFSVIKQIYLGDS